MAIFRRDTPPAPAPAGTAAPAGAETGAGAARRPGSPGSGTVTLIAPGTKVKGQVTGSAEVQIDGEVEGDLTVQGLVVVGTGGSMNGPIAAQVVRVVGQVIGNVTASERVEVGAAGTLEGDIAAPRVVIAEGAFFKGKIDMKGDKNQEPQRPSNSGKGGGGDSAKAAAEAGSK
jgi:cytoskeletal protein CcmA (bactofilin family)